MEAGGFEPPSQESQHTAIKGVNKPETPDMSACMSFFWKNDLELAQLVDAWPKLSRPVKAGILAMVEVAASV